MEIFSIQHLHGLSAEANVLLFKLNNGNFYVVRMTVIDVSAVVRHMRTPPKMIPNSGIDTVRLVAACHNHLTKFLIVPHACAALP